MLQSTSSQSDINIDWRYRLEKDVIASSEEASTRILSCAILNWVIQLFRMTDSLLASAIAASIIILSVWGLTWIVNRIAGLPISMVEAGLLMIGSVLTGLAFFIVKGLHDIILPPNRKLMAELPADKDGLEAIQNWFKKKFRVRRQIATSILAGMLAVISLKALSTGSAIMKENWGVYIGIFIGMFAVGNGAHCARNIPTLARAACKHRLRLYPYDPASSAAMQIVSSGFGKLSLANGLVVTIIMILLFALHPWQAQLTLTIAAFWLLLGWGVVTYSFAYPHYYMAQAISKEKKIQVERLEHLITVRNTNLEGLTQEEFDKLKKMVELREIISKARNTAIDLNAWKSYLSSLVLPLLSFVIGVIKNYLSFAKTSFCSKIPRIGLT
jgi:hypothetical protein